ncbi:MAG: 50S ribosomal protein L15 [Chitinophagaceae bacterium]|nr:50S ribosomal protein L15 [Chitinophagaceae bacterium]
MKLHNLKPATGSVKKEKRIGRGTGSGHGGTSTRGHKGAQSRSGYSRKIGFEGGQMPLHRRIPKFGFNNNNKKKYRTINVGLLNSFVESTKIIELTHDVLIQNEICNKKDSIKILNKGELNHKISVFAHKFSQEAVHTIEKLGGKVHIINENKNKL